MNTKPPLVRRGFLQVLTILFAVTMTGAFAVYSHRKANKGFIHGTKSTQVPEDLRLPDAAGEPPKEYVSLRAAECALWDAAPQGPQPGLFPDLAAWQPPATIAADARVAQTLAPNPMPKAIPNSTNGVLVLSGSKSYTGMSNVLSGVIQIGNVPESGGAPVMEKGFAGNQGAKSKSVLRGPSTYTGMQGVKSGTLFTPDAAGDIITRVTRPVLPDPIPEAIPRSTNGVTVFSGGKSLSAGTLTFGNRETLVPSILSPAQFTISQNAVTTLSGPTFAAAPAAPEPPSPVTGNELKSFKNLFTFTSTKSGTFFMPDGVAPRESAGDIERSAFFDLSGPLTLAPGQIPRETLIGGVKSNGIFSYRSLPPFLLHKLLKAESDTLIERIPGPVKSVEFEKAGTRSLTVVLPPPAAMVPIGTVLLQYSPIHSVVPSMTGTGLRIREVNRPKATTSFIQISPGGVHVEHLPPRVPYVISSYHGTAFSTSKSGPIFPALPPPPLLGPSAPPPPPVRPPSARPVAQPAPVQPP